MRICSLVLIFLMGGGLAAQELTGSELLEKAIAYHDPNQEWNSFKAALQVTMQTPNASDRVSTIAMDFPASKFGLEVAKDGDTYAYTFDGDACEMTLNGSNEISEADAEKFRLSCDRGAMMRNYYTYLYGLPMKLRDSGTHLDPKVLTKTFMGKEYKVLKVTYDVEVGDDIWYFYFDPNTYAMEVYQFFHDESKNDGEYILLSGMETVQGVLMPKTRKWYYNSNDKYLGTDILN